MRGQQVDPAVTAKIDADIARMRNHPTMSTRSIGKTYGVSEGYVRKRKRLADEPVKAAIRHIQRAPNPVRAASEGLALLDANFEWDRATRRKIVSAYFGIVFHGADDLKDLIDQCEDALLKAQLLKLASDIGKNVAATPIDEWRQTIENGQATDLADADLEAKLREAV